MVKKLLERLVNRFPNSFRYSILYLTISVLNFFSLPTVIRYLGVFEHLNILPESQNLEIIFFFPELHFIPFFLIGLYLLISFSVGYHYQTPKELYRSRFRSSPPTLKSRASFINTSSPTSIKNWGLSILVIIILIDFNSLLLNAMINSDLNYIHLVDELF